MATYRKRDYTPRLRGRKLEEYRKIMQRERAGLFVGPERLAWILKRYPPEKEWGRGFEPLPYDEPTEPIIPDEHT